MCKPITHIFVAIAFVSVLFGGDVSAAEDREQLRGSTVATQFAWTAGVTALPIGAGTGLASFGFAMPSTNFVGVVFYSFLGALGAGAIAATFTLPTYMTNQIAAPEVDQTYLLGPLVGSAVGGVAGIYVGRLISNNLWRTPRLDWEQRRARTGFAIGVPITVGLTVGGVTGYLLQHRRRANAERNAANASPEPPTVTPVVARPAGSRDSGWTLGARMRF